MPRQAPPPCRELEWGGPRSQCPPIDMLGRVTGDPWIFIFCPKEAARAGLPRETGKLREEPGAWLHILEARLSELTWLFKTE